MAFEFEQREAMHLLQSIEMGRTRPEDIFPLVEAADPTLVYFLVTWLRNHYAGHSAAEAVYGRIAELCQRYPKTTQILAKGKRDALVDWFEESHEYRDFDAEGFVAIVVEKLEG